MWKYGISNLVAIHIMPTCMQIEVLPCTEETERSSDQAEEISTSQSSQAQDHRDNDAEIGSPPPKKRKRQIAIGRLGME